MTESMGLAWGLGFSETGVAELVQGPALRMTLENEKAWLWMNCDLSDQRASTTVATLPHLPPAAVAMLCSTSERQQIDCFG